MRLDTASWRVPLSLERGPLYYFPVVRCLILGEEVAATEVKKYYLSGIKGHSLSPLVFFLSRVQFPALPPTNAEYSSVSEGV